MTSIRDFYRLLDETGEVPCQSAPSMFFTDDEQTTSEKILNVRYAKQLCWGCPIRLECLDYAVSNSETEGVWGGLAERERKGLRRGRAA